MEDVIEEGVEAEEEMIDEAETEGRRRRGKDFEWEEMVNFKNNHEFEGSEMKAEIVELMTKRKEWKTSWAINQNFTCKFLKKKGFKSCPRQLKVCLISTCFKIVVFSNRSTAMKK